jgi:hypothetical protein
LASSCRNTPVDENEELSSACTSGKVMVYELGVGDLRFTGNQQLEGAGAARLWFVRGKDMV